MNNLLHGFYHTLLTMIAVSIPVILLGGYSWESLTAGGILSIIANWAKLQAATL